MMITSFHLSFITMLTLLLAAPTAPALTGVCAVTTDMYTNLSVLTHGHCPVGFLVANDPGSYQEMVTAWRFLERCFLCLILYCTVIVFFVFCGLFDRRAPPPVHIVNINNNNFADDDQLSQAGTEVITFQSGPNPAPKPGTSYHGLYSILGIGQSQGAAVANDIGLLMLGLLNSRGDRIQFATHWASFANVISTRGITVPNFSDLSSNLVSLFISRANLPLGNKRVTFQVGSSETNILKALGQAFKSDVAQKIISLLSLLTAVLFYFRGDKAFDISRFMEVEKEYRKNYFSSAGDFFHNAVQAIDFFLTRGRMIYNGEYSAAFSTASPYTAFLTKYSDLSCADGTMVLERSWSKKLAHLAAIRKLRDEGKGLIHSVRREDLKELTVVNNRIAEMLTTQEVRMNANGMKYKPYTILLHGESGQAKSTVLSYIIKWAAAALEIPDENYDAINFCDLTDGFDEKFQKAMWADVLDDVCTALGKPGELDPAVEAILRRSNNIAYTVPKAFGDKGKVAYHAQLLLVTTNNGNLNLPQSAVCPMAFMRRFNTNCRVELKPEFRKADGTLDVTKAASTNGSVVDMWRFIVTVPVRSSSGAKMPDFVTVKIFDSTLEFLNYLTRDIKEHDKVQNNLLTGLTSIQDIRFCPECKGEGLLVPQHSCERHVHPQSDGDDHESVIAQSMSGFMPKLGSVELYRLVVSSEFRRAYTRRVAVGFACANLHWLAATIAHYVCSVVNFLANRLDDIYLFPLYCLAYHYPMKICGLAGSVQWDYRNSVRPFGLANLVAFVLCRTIEWMVSVSRWIFLRCAEAHLNVAAEQRAQMTIAGVSTLPIFSWTRNGTMMRVAGLAAIAGGLYACFKYAGPVRNFFQSQSDDEEEETINGTDALGRNPYYREPQVLPIPTSSSYAMSGSRDPQLARLVDNNLFYCEVRKLDGGDPSPKVIYCNALKVKRGRIVLPNHSLPVSGPLQITLKRSGRVCDGSKTFGLQQSQITRMPERDLAMITCNIGVPGSSNTDNFFMTGAPHRGKLEAWTFVRRHEPSDDDDSYKVVKVTYPVLAELVEKNFRAGKVESDCPAPGQSPYHFGGTPDQRTICGDCGGVTVAAVGHTRAPVIIGFHTVLVEQAPGLFGSGPCLAYSTVVMHEDLEKLHTIHSSSASFQSAFVTMPVHALPEYRSCVTKDPLEYFEDVHYKCVMNYFPELKDASTGQRFDVQIAGRLSGFRRQMKTSIYKSPISDYITDCWGIEIAKIPPLKCPPWRPERAHVIGVSREDKTKQPSHLIWAAADSYYAQLEKVLPSEFTVLTQEEAINGIPGEAYIDGINNSTSGGFGLEGPKSRYIDPDGDHLVQQPDGSTILKIKYVQAIDEEVEVYRQSYLSGYRRPAIFTAVHKDELLSEEKARDGKLRQIFCSPLPYTILVRMYLMRFIAFMQTERVASEAAVGLNAMGPQWKNMRKYLTTFGPDTCFDGDYKGFDKSVVSGNILGVVLDVIYRIVSPRLPNDDDRTILAGILSDMRNPLVDFHGTLAMFDMNPSGNPITVIINCMANSILARAVWGLLHPIVGLGHAVDLMYDEDDDYMRAVDAATILVAVYNVPVEKFRNAISSYSEHVRLITYGDDNVFNVHRDAGWFNHTSFAAACSVLGIDYTHADKSDPRTIRIPYKSVDEVTFLKRSFSIDHDTGLVMAPLDKASFANMLHYNRKNALKTPEALTAATLESWILESVQHGRMYYDQVQNIVADIAAKFPGIAVHLTRVPASTLFFKTYEQVLETSYGYVQRDQ